MSDNEQLYISYEVISKDADGNVLRTDTIEEVGSLTITDIGKAATRKGLDQLEIQPLRVEGKRGDETVARMESGQGKE